MLFERSTPLLWVVSVLCWGGSLAFGTAAIDVMPSTTQNTTLQIGQTISLSVDGVVTNPQDSNDGVFTFDQDLIVAAIPGGSSSPLQVIGVSRPGVDDTLYGGGDGSIVSTGANNIYGGYDSQSEGIGSSVTLYTVTLQAVSVGTAVVSSGPSVNPYGVDLMLYQSSSPSITYDAGPTITVVAAPEPAMLSGILAGYVVLMGRRGRLQKN